MNEDRINHSIAVARKMVEIAINMHLSEKNKKNCFIVGYNHDIGYEFKKDGLNYNIIGETF